MTPALRRLDGADLLAWLRLSRSESVGPRTFHSLIQRFGSASAAIAAVPRLPQRPGARAIRLAAADEVEREADALARAGIMLLPACDPAYPAPLRAIDAPPPILAVKGRPEVLARPMAAIVGSRNASAGGLIMTERFARALGEAGFVVVSGLARGIDARAHQASLATGTVAVLAGGHDRLYPSENAGLAARIAETGAVISEMPFGWEPRGRDFPRRNRIVSGLSLGVLVVEAAARSGSLITARFALEQGRAVFAMPGSPLDPRAEGHAALVREGATSCSRPEHLIEDLTPMVGSPPDFALREPRPGDETFWDEAEVTAGDEAPFLAPRGRRGGAVAEQGSLALESVPAADDRGIVLDLVGAAGATVDDIVRAAALPAGTVQAILMELEVEGLLMRDGSSAVMRRPG